MIVCGYFCYGGFDFSQIWDFIVLILVWVLDLMCDVECLVFYMWFWLLKDMFVDCVVFDQIFYDFWEWQGFFEGVLGECLKYVWFVDVIVWINVCFVLQMIGCDQYGLECLQEYMIDIGVIILVEIYLQGFQKCVLEKDFKVLEGQQEIYFWMLDSINKFEVVISEECILID